MDKILATFRLIVVILISIFFLIGQPLSGISQDKKMAKRIIDTLSSPYFAGRGYVDDGDLKAARFIIQRFRDLKLHSFNDAKDFIQPFNMEVNTFPGKMEAKVDGEMLIPGKDYIVDPVSGGCKNEKLELVFIDSMRLQQIIQDHPGKLPKRKFALVFEKNDLEKALKIAGQKLNKLKASAIISTTTGRLVWSVSETAIDIPFIEIKKYAISDQSKNITLEIDSKLISHQTQNIVGYVEGSLYPDSFIFLTAHYDHLGKMGKDTYFPGANDNASGIAMLLDLASWFSKPGNRPKYSIGFIAFAGEEAGLVGSKYYTTYPVSPLKNISFLINIDLMANGQDGMTVVNGSVFKKEFAGIKRLNDSAHYLKAIEVRGKAANSDHYWFSENGVKAFFFYLLGAYPYYHDIYDTSDKPSLAGYDGAFNLIKDFIKTFWN